uniref:Cytochrome c oxidase assembly protein COX20, mitochondrial n=1 Tax=Amblyomma triste TaxID=251400 RepID=A0A023G6N6_AMBTT
MAENTNDSDDAPRKRVKLMGRYIDEIPCFRQVFMAGILGGLGVGLGTFMLTSRPRRASDMAMVSFVAITWSYWFYCRYQYSKINFEFRKLQKHMQIGVVMQGTDQKPDVEERKLDEA